MCAPIAICVTKTITEASSGDSGKIVCGKRHAKEACLVSRASSPDQVMVATSRDFTALNARKSNRSYAIFSEPAMKKGALIKDG